MRDQANIALGDRIKLLHSASNETYGRPRIQADLHDEQIFASDKRVARLMRERNIQGASRRKSFKTTIRNKDHNQLLIWSTVSLLPRRRINYGLQT